MSDILKGLFGVFWLRHMAEIIIYYHSAHVLVQIEENNFTQLKLWPYCVGVLGQHIRMRKFQRHLKFLITNAFIVYTFIYGEFHQDLLFYLRKPYHVGKLNGM